MGGIGGALGSLAGAQGVSIANSNSQLFFGRAWQLLILDTTGGSIATVPTGSVFPGIDVSQLHIEFHIERAIAEPTGQTAEITVYNLNASDASNIAANASDVSLSAGYQNGPYGLVFAGRIIQVLLGKMEDGLTFFTRLICIAGDAALNTNFANLSLASNQTGRQILQTISRSANIPFDVKIDPTIQSDNVTLQRGKTLFGKPLDYLRSFSIQNNATYYYDQNAFNIVNLNTSAPPPSSVPNLSATTGMINIPQQTAEGVHVRSLINANLTLNSWVYINNQTINQFQISLGQNPLSYLLDLDGLYRIISMTIDGDTRGNDWYMDLITLSQFGFTANLLTVPTQTGL